MIQLSFIVHPASNQAFVVSVVNEVNSYLAEHTATHICGRATHQGRP